MEKTEAVESAHVDKDSAQNVVLSSEVDSARVWNPMLILSCVFFAASSMLFGFDDKVISPVAAMETFVSRHSIDIFGPEHHLTKKPTSRSPSSKETIPRQQLSFSLPITRTWSSACPLWVPSSVLRLLRP